MISLITTLVAVPIGVILVRVVAELTLVVFSINENLGAIRNRGEVLESVNRK